MYFETIQSVNFTVDLTQGVFIDRFHRIDPTKTYNFKAPTSVTSASHKITAKCGILCPNTLLLTEKQPHAIRFFVATCNVCLPGKSPITGKSFIINKVSMKRQRDPFEMGILAKMAEMANNHQVDK